MAIDFNTQPYYDDFDETKKFYRILFKPGYAVQARELTQLQTILADQIKKFGDNIFIDGTSVVGGEKRFETDLISVSINSTFNSTLISSDTLDTFVGKTIVGVTSTTQGYVRAVIFGDTSHTLIVKATSGNTLNNGNTFNSSETLNINSVGVATTNAVNKSLLFSVKAGIFYVSGHFVYTQDQSIVVDPTSNSSSWNLGFAVNETFVNADDDTDLLDNAAGTYNYAAPGADRYVIDLVLTNKTQDASIDNFIELARIDNGQYIVKDPITVYNTIGKEMARRTYDESGDYAVSNFPLILKENFVVTAATSIVKDSFYKIVSVGSTDFTAIGASANTVGVVFKSTNTIPVTGSGTVINQSQFVVALDPGKAYIKGYEFQTSNQNYLVVDKAQTTDTLSSIETYTSYGNYVNVKNIGGGGTSTPLASPSNNFITNTATSTNSYTTVQLHSAVRASVVGPATRLGTAKVRFVKWQSGTVGSSAAIYRVYLFDIVMEGINSFKDTESIVVMTAAGTAADFGVDIDLSSKAGGVIGGDAFLSGADSTALLFPANNTYLSNTSSVGYRIQRTYPGTAFNSGVANLTAGTNELFVGGTVGVDSGVDLKNMYYHIVVTDPQSSGLGAGTVLDMTASARTIIRTSAGAGVTLDAKSGTFTGTVIATLEVDAQAPRTKTLSTYQYRVFTAGAANRVIGGKDSLLKADGYDLLAVYNTGASDPTTALGTQFNATTGSIGTVASTSANVTRNYTFDNGQRDDRYDHATVVLSANPPAATDYVVAVFRVFTHSGGNISGNGYLSVNSYTNSGIDYANIPTFTSPTTGIVYKLSDCFDFRPRRTDGAATLAFGQVPDPLDSVSSTYSYYYARKDRVLATAAKTFEIKKGTPALSPLVPEDNSDGMTLYVLSIPPYTSNLNDISVKYIDNRRYTMRDIGKIEKRIANVEYYTQLSMLEKQAQDESIQDSSGVEKFKNGILTDAFAGHTVGDTQNQDYRCSIDMQRRELRSFAETQQAGLNYTSGSNVSRTGDLITLAYTEDSFATQPFATKAININPFNVVSFIGTINLEPSQDIWVDTLTLPPLNVTQDVNVTRNTFNGVRGQPNWWWGNNWGWNGGWGWGGWGWGWWGGWGGWGWGGWWNWPRVRTTTTTSVDITEESDSLGTNVVDLQFLPFIRSRTIIGKSNGFKPNTRHWPFMDTTNVSDRCCPLQRVVINATASLGKLFDDSLGVYETVTFTGGATANVALVGPAIGGSRNMWVFNLTGTPATGTITGATIGGIVNTNSVTSVATAPVLNDPIYTDASGLVAFEFRIPGGTFRTGERTVRLIDNVDNNTASSASSGDTTYFALGQLKTEQETILTTRTITTTIATTQTIGWADPVAESFLVDANVYPNGIHLSSIDLYFRTKASAIPVTVEIRKMINGGLPESVSTVAFGKSTLFPEDVNISEDSNTATNFKFPSTVYLPAGEYCFVVMANSNEYEVWVAEMGATLINTNRVRMTQQPYAGSLFKSENGTDWLIVPTEDIKFKVNRCKFIGSTGTANLSVDEPYNVAFAASNGTRTLNSDTITAVPAAVFNSIGLGMVISGTGVPAGTTITATNYTSGATGTITMSVVASATSSTALRYYGTYEYGLINLNATTIAPAATTVSVAVKPLTKGGSMDGSFTTIINKQDYEFPVIKNVIPSIANSGTSSLQLQATLSTTSDAVSPVIDVGRIGVTLVKNVINNDSSFEGSTSVNAGSFVTGKSYTITTLGDTTWGSIGAATAATGTGATSGANTTLTISGTVTGTFKIGQQVSGTNIVAGTTITAFGTGVGGTGTYTLSQNAAGVVSGTVSAFEVGTQFLATGAGTAGVGAGVASSVTKSGGSALSKYITKKVVLVDGFDASNIVVTFDAYKPGSTDVKAYYKLLPVEKTTPIDDESWVPMRLEAPVGFSSDINDYREHKFYPTNAFDQYGNVIDNPISPRFNSFAVKIVMLSSNEAVAPRVRDFRTIALYK